MNPSSRDFGPDRPAVGGVIVTYHPDAALETRIRAIQAEVTSLIVVDNTASPEVRTRLAAIAESRGIEIIYHDENLGIGRALNVGFGWLAERGFAWAIAFDQDSVPAPGFTAALLRAAETQGARAGIVGANWCVVARPDRPARHLKRHRVPGLFRRVPAATDIPDATCVIASGSLFNLAAWRAVGGFDDSLFLDLVDSDICLRMRAEGFAVRVAAGARLSHHRGAKREVRLGGRSWWPAHMPESRLYYLFRNRVLLVGRQLGRTPHWVAFELTYAAKIIAEITFLEDRKLTKLAACARGTWDGLLGRRGRIR
jgi:rhamnosyltransferase